SVYDEGGGAQPRPARRSLPGGQQPADGHRVDRRDCAWLCRTSDAARAAGDRGGPSAAGVCYGTPAYAVARLAEPHALGCFGGGRRRGGRSDRTELVYVDRGRRRYAGQRPAWRRCLIGGSSLSSSCSERCAMGCRPVAFWRLARCRKEVFCRGSCAWRPAICSSPSSPPASGKAVCQAWWVAAVPWRRWPPPNGSGRRWAQASQAPPLLRLCSERKGQGILVPFSAIMSLLDTNVMRLRGAGVCTAGLTALLASAGPATADSIVSGGLTRQYEIFRPANLAGAVPA